MKTFLFILLFLFFSLSSYGVEKKSYNEHYFIWKASCKDTVIIRTNKTTRFRKTWKIVRKKLNSMARAGKIRPNRLFRVELIWRGKKYIRYIVAHKTKGPWSILPDNKKSNPFNQFFRYGRYGRRPRCSP